jgi:hypothetical protein
MYILVPVDHLSFLYAHVNVLSNCQSWSRYSYTNIHVPPPPLVDSPNKNIIVPWWWMTEEHTDEAKGRIGPNFHPLLHMWEDSLSSAHPLPEATELC